MTAKVSICIPTYNRKDYLKETLASIFAQTYKDFEVVIVDDGSTDGTEQMLKDGGYDVRYNWQENRGDAAARNKLIQLAQGQFIAFIDSDDLFMPDAIERMISATEKEGGDVIVYGAYFGIDEKGAVTKRCKRRLYSGFITKYLFDDILVHSCGSMFPKKALEAAGGFDESLRVCSDYDLWLKLSLKYRFIAMDEPTFKRRRHGGNLSMRSTANRVTELRVLERFYFEGGGSSVIPEELAMKRLAKESYRAGKCALHEGQYDLAAELLRSSLKRKPTIKALAYYLYARVRN